MRGPGQVLTPAKQFITTQRGNCGFFMPNHKKQRQLLLLLLFIYYATKAAQ